MAHRTNGVAAETVLNIATQDMAKADEDLCLNDRQLSFMLKIHTNNRSYFSADSAQIDMTLDFNS